MRSSSAQILALLEGGITMDENVYLDEAILDLRSGSAVCLLGAGFSIGALDCRGVEVPSTKQLAKELCELASIPWQEDMPLEDISDYCAADSNLAPQLSQLLMERLTLTKPSETQRTLLNFPWRGIFTTNFDDICEQSVNVSHPISPSSLSRFVPVGKTPVYYMHGRARDLHEGKAIEDFVLSETSYLSLKDENREIYDLLENAIYTSRRLFVVGYSLKDLDLASKLFGVDRLRERCLIITREGASDFDIARYKKFGRVFKIGADGFVQRVISSSANGLEINSRKFSYIKISDTLEASDRIIADDFRNLILTGKFDITKFHRQLIQPQGTLYCVNRETTADRIFDLHSKGSRKFLVHSDLGNGKTTFLDQLAARAVVRDFEVIRISSTLQEVNDELQIALDSSGRKLFLIDDYIRFQRQAQLIAERINPNSMLVMSTRALVDDNFYSKTSLKVGGELRDINIDKLTTAELEQWNRLIEEWGYWGDRAGHSISDRISFLQKECGAENRSIIISLFKNSNLRERISQLVDFFVNKNPEHRIAFVAILINSLCQQHVEWERISHWLNIDENRLRRSLEESNISGILADGRNWYELTSTQLADFILNEFDFEIDDIVYVYVKIVRETAYSSGDRVNGRDSIQNLKELMRYRFLTRLFGNHQDHKAIISAVYGRLQTVTIIRKSDQFWLQYAMARMETGELDEAEAYLETAMGIANDKDRSAKANGWEGYRSFQIVDQKARLLLKKAADSTRKLNESEIIDAVAILKSSLEDKAALAVHPLRSAELIEDVLELRCDEMSSNSLDMLRNIVSLMSDRASESERLERSQVGETAAIRNHIRKSKIILNNL